MRSLTNFSDASLISLIVGLIMGFLAQRSRMCFIGGWRDYFLIKDKYLLKGFFGFLIASAAFFFIFSAAGQRLIDYPWYDRAAPSFTLESIYDPFTDDYDERFGEVTIQPYRDMSYCELLLSPVTLTEADMVGIKGINFFGITISNELALTMAAALLLGFFTTLANGCPTRQHVMAASGNVSAVFYLAGFYAGVLVYDEYVVDLMNSLVNALSF